MANSPFDSPEIAARFRHMNSFNTVTPSPVRKPSPRMFNAAPGWNRPSPTMQRAVSASNGSNRFGADSESLSPKGVERVPQSSRDYVRRYDDIRSLETSKNELIEELIVRYETLNKQYEKLVDDHDREREYNRGTQTREKTYAENVRRLKACLDRDPFVVVLVDAESLTFKPELLAKGEVGGRRAATLLQQQVQDYVASILPDLGHDIRITARIYGDLKHLSDRCQRAQITDRRATFEDFVTGFNGNHGLFDLVDTGNQRSVSRQKVTDQLHLYLNDFHCRQIILGRSRNTEDAQLLKDYAQDEQMLNRITLLEGPAPLDEPEQLPFECIRFDSVFDEPDLQFQTSSGAPDIDISSSSNGLPTPPASLPAISRQLSEVSVQDVKDFMPTRPMAQPAGVTSARASPKNSPSHLSAAPAKPSPLGSWATLAAKPPPPASVIPPPPPAKAAAPSTPTIPRNRLGQRVDPIIKHDKAEVDRVKKMKMCNVHYLRGTCPYGDGCSHSHIPKPSTADLQTLKLVARMAPCQNGSDCEDLKCIYGHICPAPEGRNGESCIFDKYCRFPDHLHKIDRAVVRSVKVS